MGELVTFGANGGVASGYLAPPQRATAPGVVVIQEWWGLNDNIKGVADRFAAAGYLALAPDLYHGVVTKEPNEAAKLLMALNIEGAAKDLKGSIDFLHERTGRPVGMVGFCMGGALSLFAACKNGQRVGACVDFYGGHPNVSYDLAGLTAPVLGLFGERDHGVSPEVVRALARQLTDLGKVHEMVTYPGADHAFFNDERPEVFHAVAAADAWRRTVDFFQRHLG